MARPAVDSPLFRRDVLRRIVEDTLNAPHFPHDKVQEALRADRDVHARLPALSERDRLVVEEACQVLAMYRSTQAPDTSDQDRLYALQLQYTQAGCTILLCDLAGARRMLDMLARELRPRPQSTLSTSIEGMQLNVAVLGTLQWLSGAQDQSHDAERYARWRTQVESQLAK